MDDAKTEAKIESQNAATTMARPMSTREQWLVKQRMAVLRNNHILTFGKVFETSLTPGTLCHSFHTLLHMADHPKSMYPAY